MLHWFFLFKWDLKFACVLVCLNFSIAKNVHKYDWGAPYFFFKALLICDHDVGCVLDFQVTLSKSTWQISTLLCWSQHHIIFEPICFELNSNHIWCIFDVSQTRMRNTLEHFRDGKNLTIGFIGGSVTSGNGKNDGHSFVEWTSFVLRSMLGADVKVSDLCSMN